MKELTELEQAALDFYQEYPEGSYTPNWTNSMIAIWEQGKKIHDSLKPKPVFPAEGGWYVDEFGVHKMREKKTYLEFAVQGRTFYTREEAEAFVKREQAQTRIIEKIHQANGGKRGFIAGEANVHAIYCHDSHQIAFVTDYWNQFLDDPFYMSGEACGKLSNDKDFISDYEIYLGVE